MYFLTKQNFPKHEIPWQRKCSVTESFFLNRNSNSWVSRNTSLSRSLAFTAVPEGTIFTVCTLLLPQKRTLKGKMTTLWTRALLLKFMLSLKYVFLKFTLIKGADTKICLGLPMRGYKYTLRVLFQFSFVSTSLLEYTYENRISKNSLS